MVLFFSFLWYRNASHTRLFLCYWLQHRWRHTSLYRRRAHNNIQNQIKSNPFIHLLFKSNGDSYSRNSSCKLFRNSISLRLHCLLIFRFKVGDNIFIFLHNVYVSSRYCFQLLLSFASNPSLCNYINPLVTFVN